MVYRRSARICIGSKGIGRGSAAICGIKQGSIKCQQGYAECRKRIHRGTAVTRRESARIFLVFRGFFYSTSLFNPKNRVKIHNLAVCLFTYLLEM
jgi:hypothetical protein